MDRTDGWNNGVTEIPKTTVIVHGHKEACELILTIPPLFTTKPTHDDLYFDVVVTSTFHLLLRCVSEIVTLQRAQMDICLVVSQVHYWCPLDWWSQQLATGRRLPVICRCVFSVWRRDQLLSPIPSQAAIFPVFQSQGIWLAFHDFIFLTSSSGPYLKHKSCILKVCTCRINHSIDSNVDVDLPVNHLDVTYDSIHYSPHYTTLKCLRTSRRALISTW